MNSRARKLSRQYVATLCRYLDRQQESLLEEAYELGRKASAGGLGVLDMARNHQRALTSCLSHPLSAEAKTRVFKAAEVFFMEALSPFEATHRGFREANLELRQLNAELKRRNAELAALNRELTREISERRRVERALQESESRFRSVVQSARDGVMTADAAGRITFMNRRAEEIFGYAHAAMLGKSWTLFAPKEFRDEYRQRLERVVSDPGFARAGRTVEVCARRKNGTVFPLEISYSVWKIEAGTFYTGIVRDITERKRAEAELRQSREHYRTLFNQACVMQENLRNLSNQILHVQEEERKHISRELHDEVGQSLTAINTNLTMLQRNGAVDGALLKKKIADTQSLLQQTMETVHRFARELRPAMLDELGLLPALRCYLKNFAGRTGLRVRFEGSPEAEHLNDDQKTVVYRVTQESLTNVAKHAQASRVQVSVRKLTRGLQVEIKDNGKAFAVDQQLAGKDRKRLGLLGMQERVRLVNGRFAIESAPGKGTAVRVEIPFKPDKEKLTYAKNNRATG